MIVTELNPTWIDSATYVEFLNRGFPGKWDSASFDWYLRRSFNGKATDIGVRTEGSKILSCVAYSYRQIKDAAGRLMEVCVMLAGVTLPEERGRGHYASLLQTGIDLCPEKSCVAILGFTTHENTSGRGLVRIGALSIPSFYLLSTGMAARRRTRRRASPSALALSDLSKLQAPGGHSGHVQFHYENSLDWRRQFAERPNPVQGVRVGHDAIALVETVGATDRLQWLHCPDNKTVATIGALADASAARGRQFFMYTLDPLLAQSMTRLGLRIRKGFLKVLPIDRAPLEHLLHAPWRLHSGDRL